MSKRRIVLPVATGAMSSEHLTSVIGRRSSGAAGTHVNKGQRRTRTRSAAKNAAVREQY